MSFGAKIEMLRDYDSGRLAEGDVYAVQAKTNLDSGHVSQQLAKSLCRPAADGEGPYARQLDNSDSQDEEPS